MMSAIAAKVPELASAVLAADPELGSEPKDARIVVKNGKPAVVPGVNGIVLDAPALARAALPALTDGTRVASVPGALEIPLALQALGDRWVQSADDPVFAQARSEREVVVHCRAGFSGHRHRHSLEHVGQPGAVEDLPQGHRHRFRVGLIAPGEVHVGDGVRRT